MSVAIGAALKKIVVVLLTVTVNRVLRVHSYL